MGKSTLTNARCLPPRPASAIFPSRMLPHHHHAALYHLDDDSHLSIRPVWELASATRHELAGLFPEMRPYIGHCRFHNCTHRAEPNCAIKGACDEGRIRPARLALLQKLTNRIVNA
jgi:ribosome biogenesis GTPase